MITHGKHVVEITIHERRIFFINNFPLGEKDHAIRNKRSFMVDSIWCFYFIFNLFCCEFLKRSDACFLNL
ncbi:MAG: hypothetical protein D8M57_09965 [Candidatus Scalindua sp. AMX11]|nr:MAG: hypothetical protein DWQ00_08715 [Candidatus Scalindua sp.]TDE65071.1 MAG: hypothetical protein D8M57_09965 [Candidatus Scalindua sp. AMX11]